MSKKNLNFYLIRCGWFNQSVWCNHNNHSGGSYEPINLETFHAFAPEKDLASSSALPQTSSKESAAAWMMAAQIISNIKNIWSFCLEALIYAGRFLKKVPLKTEVHESGMLVDNDNCLLKSLVAKKALWFSILIVWVIMPWGSVLFYRISVQFDLSRLRDLALI